METENKKIKVITKANEKYVIYDIKVETRFIDNPFVVAYCLMGKISPNEDKWVKLGLYIEEKEEKLFIHLKNLRRMLEFYHFYHYDAEYNMAIFERD